MFNSAGAPDARQFFRGRASLWGEPVSHDAHTTAESPAPAGSGAGLATAGGAALLAPQPRWSRVSSTGTPRAARRTPSPRREAADHSEVTPPKLDLANSGLPRLMRASMGPRPAASADPRPAAASPAGTKRTGSATPPRVLSAPLPAWTAAAAEATEGGAAEAKEESVVSHRLRSKTPPRVGFRAGGPASSLGSLLENIQPIPDAAAFTPLKKPRTARWMAEMRGTAMLEVPLEALADADENAPEPGAEKGHSQYPRRIRIPTLDFWRGERVVYERTKGSATPSVRGVRLNGAPRSESMWDRDIPAKAAQQAVPVLLDGQEAEFVSTNTQRLLSKLVVLPPWIGGKVHPPTWVLPPFSTGHLFVIEGSICYGFEEDYQQATLNAGDHLLLPGYQQELLIAAAGARNNSAGAKFKVILVSADAKKPRSEDALPIEAS